jgi:hypothetical protein
VMGLSKEDETRVTKGKTRRGYGRRIAFVHWRPAPSRRMRARTNVCMLRFAAGRRTSPLGTLSKGCGCHIRISCFV